MSNRVNSMDVIISAPNQNREQFSSHLERLIPFFAARALNRIVSLTEGLTPLQIDAWNSFGSQMDQSFAKQTQFDGASREEYSDLILKQKYELLEEVGVDTSSHEVVRDDDDATKKWMLDKISELYSKGIIYEDKESVNACASCGNIISSASSGASICSRCSSTDIKIDKRRTLFMDLPGDRVDYIRDRIDLPRKSSFINGQFATLPGRVMIARRRDYGQELGIPNYEDQVLDPKIGLSLMPEMLAERYDIDSLTQVQGSTTAKNTAPYTVRLSPELNSRYIFTGNIPSNIDTGKLNELGVSFFTKYLPIFMLDRSGNLSQQQLDALSAEYSKVSRKLGNVLSYLQSHEGEPTKEIGGATDKLREAVSAIALRDVRTGVLDVRKYIYDDLSKHYADELRINGRSIPSRDIDFVRETTSEIL